MGWRLVLVLCLWAAPLLAAPAALKAGTYVPGDPESKKATERFIYTPGMVRLENKGRVWGIPVLAHFPPRKPGGQGVLLCLPEPTEVRRPYNPVVIYQLVPGSKAVNLYFDALRGSPSHVLAEARRLSQPAKDLDLYIPQSVHEEWSALPVFPVEDKPQVMGLLRGILTYAETRYAAPVIPLWLAGKGYNPFTSMPALADWMRAHSTDADVVELVQASAKRIMARKGGGRATRP